MSENEENEENEPNEVPKKRDEWEIKEDLRAVKRALKIFSDKERLEDVQDLIRANKKVGDSLDAVADGDMQKALGFM